MAQGTYIARKGQDADFADVTVTTLSINGTTVEGGVLLGTSEVVDLQGEANALVLDADGDTHISAPTDDQIDIAVSGADDFRITANTLTALSGSTIATNTIAETTAGSGVTIDGVLLKDGGAVFADAATIEIDTVNEATSAAGVTVDGVLIKDGVAVTRSSYVNVTADGAITIPDGDTIYNITKVGVAAMTLADPAAGDNGLRLTFVSSTAQAHTLDNSAGSGFNAGGAATDVGTWGGAIADMLEIVALGGVWYITINTNVTLA